MKLKSEILFSLTKIGNFIFIKYSELGKINEKLAMTSQFDLTQFYDIIIRNSVFLLGFLSWEFQIPLFSASSMFSMICGICC